MDYFFGTHKPTKKEKPSGPRSYHLISVRKTANGPDILDVESMGFTKQAARPSQAAGRFITFLCGKSTFSKKLKKLSGKKKCSYYITIRQVENTPSGATSTSLEPVLYKNGKEIVHDYTGKVVKDRRVVMIDGDPVVYKTRVILKAV